MLAILASFFLKKREGEGRGGGAPCKKGEKIMFIWLCCLVGFLGFVCLILLAVVWGRIHIIIAVQIMIND